jgi:hypothetical protein
MTIASFRLNTLSAVAAAAAVISRAANFITEVGNVKISTAQSKFGGSSALFDGAGDRLDVSNTGNPFNLGTGNFTYECFVNITAINAGDRHAVFYHDDGCRIEIRRTGANIYPHIYLNNTLADPTDPQITSSQYITTGTWNHIALVRNSNTLTVYVNGVSGGTSATLGATLSSQSALYIGNREDNSLSLNGYLDELRVSNTARYTANFTPPAAAFVNDANTLLLIHADGTNNSTLFLDDTPTLTPFLSLAVASQSSPFINVYNRSEDTFTKLSNPASLPSISGSQQHIAINRDGTSIAIGGGTSPYIHIYNRSGDTLTKLSNPGTLPPAEVHGIAWNHSGTSLACVHDGSPYVTIYNRSGNTFTKLSNPATLPGGGGEGVAWNHDGTSLAVAFYGATNGILVYNRSGDTFSVAQDLSVGSPTFSVAWNHNGTSLVAGLANSPYVKIFNRSGDTFTAVSNPATLPPQAGYGVAFNHDGTSLAVASPSTPYVTIYNRSGDTFTKLSNPATLPPAAAQDVTWNHDGTSLAVLHNSSPYITIYNRTGDTFTKIANPASLPPSAARALQFGVKPA